MKSDPDLRTCLDACHQRVDDHRVSTPVFGPANLPATVVHTLNAAIGRAVASPEFTARFAALGGEATATSPEQFDLIVRNDLARFATLVREAGIRLD